MILSLDVPVYITVMPFISEVLILTNSTVTLTNEQLWINTYN